MGAGTGRIGAAAAGGGRVILPVSTQGDGKEDGEGGREFWGRWEVHVFGCETSAYQALGIVGTARGGGGGK